MRCLEDDESYRTKLITIDTICHIITFNPAMTFFYFNLKA